MFLVRRNEFMVCPSMVYYNFKCYKNRTDAVADQLFLNSQDFEDLSPSQLAFGL